MSQDEPGIPPRTNGSAETAAGSQPASPDSGSSSPDLRPTTPAAPAFPVAAVRDDSSAGMLVRSSRLWWLTAGCLLLAFWLTWSSIPPHGPTIRILFPDGHGLKAGDAVRHRGIDVGTVVNVALSEDLTRISATVVLTPGAAGLARDGTRFWIVRPQLSLTGVSGLETAVGSKYIAVSPGDPSAARQREFDGLTSAPPDQDSGDGLEIVLRSDSLHGVTVGAPVSWRGVEVGRILAAGLSPDARFVDIHARINAEYRRLLRSTSKFWVTSGLGVDVGLSGLKLNADSFSTILRGGVSFTTPAIGENDPPVTSGTLFILHAKPEEEWTRAATSIPLVDFVLPTTVSMQCSRKATTLGIPRMQKFTANGLLYRTHEGSVRLLTASDALTATGAEQAAASDAPAMTTIPISSAVPGSTLSITLPALNAATGIRGIHVPLDDPGELPVSAAVPRMPAGPEDCCLCRSVQNEGRLSSVIQCLSRDELRVPTDSSSTLWTISTELGDLTGWHGAPVVSMTDGAVIGVFIVTASGTGISPLSAESAGDR